MKRLYTLMLISVSAVNGVSAQTLWAWGANQYGQVGNATTNASGQKARVQISTETTWIDIDGGYQHSVALKSDGTIWAWGYNDQGEIGDNTTTDVTAPKKVGTDNDWVDIDAGYQYTLALKSNGTLWMWGDCNAINPSKVPAQFGTATDWKSIAGGWSHACGIKTDGTLWAWGAGRLGNASTAGSTVPVQIGTDAWLAVAAGEYYSIGIKSDGTLWGWGVNDYGQAGTTGGYKDVPTQIGTDANWSALTAGKRHSIAIKTDGTMWSWGYNSMNAGLGDGSTVTSRNTPGQIGTATDWKSVAAGNDHTMVLKVDGTLWAFGYNGVGPLGDNTLFVASAPTQIGSDKWTKVGVGTAHTLAIGTSETVTAIDDITSAVIAVKVYPNPNTGTFYLTAPSVLQGTNVVITDVLGTEIRRFEITGEFTELASGLASGLYFLKSGNTVIKIIVE